MKRLFLTGYLFVQSVLFGQTYLYIDSNGLDHIIPNIEELRLIYDGTGNVYKGDFVEWPDSTVPQPTGTKYAVFLVPSIERKSIQTNELDTFVYSDYGSICFYPTSFEANQIKLSTEKDNTVILATITQTHLSDLKLKFPGINIVPIQPSQHDIKEQERYKK